MTHATHGSVFDRLLDAVGEAGFMAHAASRHFTPRQLIDELKAKADNRTPIRLWEPGEVALPGLYGRGRTVERSLVIAELTSQPGWEASEMGQTWHIHVFGEDYYPSIVRLTSLLERRFMATIHVVLKRLEPLDAVALA